MTDKELQKVNFEQAQRLKTAGFDWINDRYYVNREDRVFKLDYELHPTNNPNSIDGAFSAPTVALALKWFRDTKNYIGEVQVGNLPVGKFYCSVWNLKGECLKNGDKEKPGVSGKTLCGKRHSQGAELRE